MIVLWFARSEIIEISSIFLLFNIVGVIEIIFEITLAQLPVGQKLISVESSL